MEVPITQFRREIFDLANRALNGESVSFVYKGRKLRIVPEAETRTGLDRLAPIQVVNPLYPDLDDADLKAEIQAAMEADWAEI